MNKTTIKISVLAFLGFMTYGYAQQQQQAPYKGKVGVNTIEPSATMDVQPNSDNARVEAKTNEGIIAPKLSKTRIANIATPVEGTLVYATDATYTAGSDATVNNRVAKITEKGYYFYNGTEWVKAGSEATQQIWQKQTNKDILLVDNDIQNTVKYTENGGYWNFPKQLRPSSRFETNTSSIVTESFDFYSRRLANSKILNVDYADKVLTLSMSSKEKQLVSNDFRIDGASNSSTIDRYTALFNALTTELNSTRNFQSLYGSISSSNHYGTGRVSLLMGTYNTTHIFNGSSDRIVGSFNQVSSYVSADTNRMEGTYNVIFPRGTGKINFADAVRNNLRLDSAKGDITNASTSKNEVFISQSFSNTIDNLMGTYTSFAGINSNHTGIIKKMYGLRIDNVNKGTQINRAIHTEAGEIRFGDLKGTGDRIVVADQDGVLKTSQFVMKATDTTDGCSASNAGAIHYKEIDKGGKMVGVFGFCTRDTQGNYKWAYNMGGANMLDGTGAFGSGL
ncbi:hypothetical protein [Bergeyella zoohelcum]|uniref:hypothetical protein n=2 Tax=Bergeyella zoohelcum TaxID=1015 RepID=UPI00373662E4